MQHEHFYVLGSNDRIAIYRRTARALRTQLLHAAKYYCGLHASVGSYQIHFGENVAQHQQQSAKGEYLVSYPTDINDLQHDLKQWTEKQFPSRTSASILAHLRKETHEVEAKPSDIMEYADCMMLLLDAASFNGLHVSDILSACYRKLEINKSRNWGKPNAEGFVEHIRSGKLQGEQTQ